MILAEERWYLGSVFQGQEKYTTHAHGSATEWGHHWEVPWGPACDPKSTSPTQVRGRRTKLYPILPYKGVDGMGGKWLIIIIA